MSLLRRVKELEEERSSGDERHCSMIIERVKSSDGAEELVELPRCPHGRELSKDLHECEGCELVPPSRRHHLEIVLDDVTPDPEAVCRNENCSLPLWRLDES